MPDGSPQAGGEKRPIRIPLGFEAAVAGLSAVPMPKEGRATLSDEQRDLLLYLGSDDAGPMPPVRRETLDELVAMGLLRVKGENHVAFTEAGDVMLAALVAETQPKLPGRKRKP